MFLRHEDGRPLLSLLAAAVSYMIAFGAAANILIVSSLMGAAVVIAIAVLDRFKATVNQYSFGSGLVAGDSFQNISQATNRVIESCYLATIISPGVPGLTIAFFLLIMLASKHCKARPGFRQLERQRS
jgi:hypothetical protein